MPTTRHKNKLSSAHLDVVLQVVVGGLPAAQQVARVEGVVHVPADAAGGARQVAHAKLLALQQRGVEVAQREDDGAELGLLGAGLEDLLAEEVVGAAQVGLEALGRLVGQLDGVLGKRRRREIRKEIRKWIRIL